MPSQLRRRTIVRADLRAVSVGSLRANYCSIRCDPRASRGFRAQIFAMRAEKFISPPGASHLIRAHRAHFCRFSTRFRVTHPLGGVMDGPERRHLDVKSWRRADARGELSRFVAQHWELSAPRELTEEEFNRHLQALIKARSVEARAPGQQLELSEARVERGV